MFLVLFLVLLGTEQVQPQSLLPQLHGEWAVSYRLHPGPMGPGGQGMGEMVVRKGPRDALTMDFRCTSGPMKGFSLLQLMVWNGKTAQFEMVWVDAFNPGMSGIKYGKVDGNRVVYEYESPMGERNAHHRSVVTYFSQDHFQAESSMSLDGQSFQPSMKLTYRRKGDQ